MGASGFRSSSRELAGDAGSITEWQSESPEAGPAKIATRR
jgi:hypothetical protein